MEPKVASKRKRNKARSSEYERPARRFEHSNWTTAADSCMLVFESYACTAAVSPPTLISVPPALLPAPTAQSAVVVVESAPSSQLCSEELGGSEDPAERIAAESKRQRKSRGELSQDPKDWTEQIARNQATLKELNGALEQQRQLNTDLERSLRRAQRLVSWTIAQAERQVNNETQAQLLEGGGIEASAAAAASATSAPASPAAASSSTAAAAAAPASTATDFVLYDREEEIFAAAIAAQDDPMALRTVPAQSYLDPSLHTNQTWSWMSLQYRMDIDARHILLREAKTFNQTLTQEIADACRWAERVAESAERSVEQMTLAEPMRAEIKLRIQQKAEAMIAAVMDKARTEDESTAATAEAAAAAAAESSSSSSSAAAAAPAESSAASYEAASKQQ